MKTFKVNSIGFGYSRNIRWSEGLIKGGVAMIIVGLIINHTQTRWYVAGNQDSFIFVGLKKKGDETKCGIKE